MTHKQPDAHNCPMLARMNARRERSCTSAVLILICLIWGLSLAVLVAKNGYDRAIDAVNNPHIEGF